MAQTVLPGGLTNIQNEFMKLRMKNNPEFMAEYFPNVVFNPPSGPLYDVDPSLNRPFSSPVKAMYESDDKKAAGPFDYLPNSDYDPWAVGAITSAAEWRKENVPYDTPGSVLDINPMPSGAPKAAYAMTRMGDMYQGISPPEDIHGRRTGSETGRALPVTEGQSSAMYMRPDMIEAYGTEPRAPRNEMVPRPSFWPDKSVDHVNQEDINRFIETAGQHEVSHNVSYLPEHKGSWFDQPATPLSLTGQATNIDFKEMFPAAASEEAQRAIGKLGTLHQSGAGLGAATEENPWGEPISPYIGSTYPKTWVDNLTDFDQEEIYNRAKDIEKIKRQFKDWRNHPGYIKNMNFIRGRLSRFANQLPPGQDKVSTYLKRVEPQVKQYLEKVSGQPSAGDWSPGVGGGQRGSNAPGFTDPGKGSYGPWKSQGGIIAAF